MIEEPAEQTARPQAVLQEVYGYPTFRDNQEEVVEAILAGRDVFVVMPTGGGKSLCYQLPAHMLPGTCLVVSPLISLMKDQVDAAVATGLRAACLNSALSSATRAQVMKDLRAGAIDLLYVSPERFAMESFIEALHQIRLAFVAIDEAHCLSEWGHDFRPDYLNLSSISDTFPGIPVCAFTATATHRVQQDIIDKLALRDPFTVRASFDRPNLFYRVAAKQRANDQILEFVTQRDGESGIIYRMTRKAVEDTAHFLRSQGVKALPYHAGLSDDIRAANQDAFNRDEVNVVVATIAFGMGIDKSNVRFVLHGDIPKNIESYYQETGRAGRDGEPATCLLLFSRGDIPKIRYFIDQMEDDTERAHALRCLQDMVGFAGNHACRRKQVLGYFGETYAKDDCEACDICAGDVEVTDATRDAQIVLSAVTRTGERFGAGHIVDVITGSDTQKIRQYGHDRVKTYGAGKDQGKPHWRSIIDNLLAQELLTPSEDRFPVLRLTPLSREVLFKGREVKVIHHAQPAGRTRRRSADHEPGNPQLFEQLRALRKHLADAQRVPPFVIFSDRTLHEMARVFPTTDAEMVGITGVGKRKLEQYGTLFAQAIDLFLSKNPEVEKPAPQPTLDLAPRKPR